MDISHIGHVILIWRKHNSDLKECCAPTPPPPECSMFYTAATYSVLPRHFSQWQLHSNPRPDLPQNKQTKKGPLGPQCDRGCICFCQPEWTVLTGPWNWSASRGSVQSTPFHSEAPCQVPLETLHSLPCFRYFLPGLATLVPPHEMVVPERLVWCCEAAGVPEKASGASAGQTSSSPFSDLASSAPSLPAAGNKKTKQNKLMLWILHFLYYDKDAQNNVGKNLGGRGLIQEV